MSFYLAMQDEIEKLRLRGVFNLFSHEVKVRLREDGPPSLYWLPLVEVNIVARLPDAARPDNALTKIVYTETFPLETPPEFAKECLCRVLENFWMHELMEGVRDEEGWHLFGNPHPDNS